MVRKLAIYFAIGIAVLLTPTVVKLVSDVWVGSLLPELTPVQEVAMVVFPIHLVIVLILALVLKFGVNELTVGHTSFYTVAAMILTRIYSIGDENDLGIFHFVSLALACLVVFAPMLWHQQRRRAGKTDD